MTAYWGPAFDAEIAYRHEQVSKQFGRRRRTVRADAAPAGEHRRAPLIQVQPAASTADRSARVDAPAATRRAA